jgi:hypothetical protein
MLMVGTSSPRRDTKSYKVQRLAKSLLLATPVTFVFNHFCVVLALKHGFIFIIFNSYEDEVIISNHAHSEFELKAASNRGLIKNWKSNSN